MRKNDVHVHDLKVKKDAKFEDDVHIDDKLKVEGRLRFGSSDNARTRVATSNPTGNSTVSIYNFNEPSGILLVTNGSTYTTFIVNNKHCLSTSVVIVTVRNDVPTIGATAPSTQRILSVEAFDGYFTVVTSAALPSTTATSAQSSISFIVC